MMYFLYDEIGQGDGYIGMICSIEEGRNMIRQYIEDKKGECSLYLIKQSATKEEVESVEAIPKQEYNSYWGIEEPIEEVEEDFAEDDDSFDDEFYD